MLVSFASVALATLTAGFVAGRLYERAARSWLDYRARKAEVPVLLAAARLLTGKAAGGVILAACIAILSVYVLVADRR
ncbi:MAG: hypothetical protein ACRDJ9_06050 [Dehalococcoidia bacterium]